LKGIRDQELGQFKSDVVRVVIVDNDAQESASSVVKEFASSFPFPIQYLVEPRPGIPAARNKAVAEAAGSELVAFIDDDEVPDSRWLQELLSAQIAWDADGVGGPVLPVFEYGAPSWLTKGGFFDRPRFSSGSVRDRIYTGNVLLRSTMLGFSAAPFDEALSEIGGSDSALSERLLENGAKLVWCDSALVYESVPSERANLRWLVLRRIRTTSMYVILRVQRQGGRFSWMKWMIRGCAHILLGIPRSTRLLVPSEDGRRPLRGIFAHGILEMAHGWGMVLGSFGATYREYRRNK
jgi:GT2 family glycosyltransferase